MSSGTDRQKPLILLGPGERVGPLAALLLSLAPRTRRFADVAEIADLVGSEVSNAQLVLDADEISIEDLGYVRRFVANRPGVPISIVCDDPGSRVARALAALGGVRWLAWPPDLDAILALCGESTSSSPTSARERAEDARGSRNTAAEARRAPHEAPRIEPTMGFDDDFDGPRLDTPSELRRAARADAKSAAEARRGAELEADSERREASNELRRGVPDAEMEAIHAILEGSTLLEDREDRPSAPERDVDDKPSEIVAKPENVAQSSNGLDEHVASDDTHEALANAGPPAWWRAQVADLADAAQRLELGYEALCDADPDEPEEVDENLRRLDSEVSRVVQFARTLGFLASPPSRGDQAFELGEYVQLSVAELASRGENAPRCQYRASDPVFVLSDRLVLRPAFDAFFFLPAACAQKGDLVRTEVKRDGDLAEVRIEFPAGPLAEVDVATILEPYGVRRQLPDLGPNALAAAISIVAGQEGAAELSRLKNGRLAWRITLPAVDPSLATRRPRA